MSGDILERYRRARRRYVAARVLAAPEGTLWESTFDAEAVRQWPEYREVAAMNRAQLVAVDKAHDAMRREVVRARLEFDAAEQVRDGLARVSA